MKLIDKDALVAKIEKRFDEYTSSILKHYDAYKEEKAQELGKILTIINTLEVKNVNLEKVSLTWEDIRELYIIFTEVDVEIELCKTDIQAETIGYYQEVLKRFKTQK